MIMEGNHSISFSSREKGGDSRLGVGVGMCKKKKGARGHGEQEENSKVGDGSEDAEDEKEDDETDAFRFFLLPIEREQVGIGEESVRWCRLRASCRANDLLQNWHAYGLIPKCSLAWRFRSCWRAKDLGHRGHSKGRSAV
jgi:hypothetical protein